ncbi:hypothetical protein QQ045_023294 [Rhodiola kirilowii]
MVLPPQWTTAFQRLMVLMNSQRSQKMTEQMRNPFGFRNKKWVLDQVEERKVGLPRPRMILATARRVNFACELVFQQLRTGLQGGLTLNSGLGMNHKDFQRAFRLRDVSFSIVALPVSS